MKFEWDTVKAQSNAEKHGISFAEAMTVFGDPLEVTIPDPDHSVGEARFLSLGVASGTACRWFSYTEREGPIRLISAYRLSPGSGKCMSGHNPVNPPIKNDGLRAEYDFSAGVRGKHFQQYKAGSNVVFLDADVAKAFKDSESVNQALRLLRELAKRQLLPERAA